MFFRAGLPKEKRVLGPWWSHVSFFALVLHAGVGREAHCWGMAEKERLQDDEGAWVWGCLFNYNVLGKWCGWHDDVLAVQQFLDHCTHH